MIDIDRNGNTIYSLNKSDLSYERDSLSIERDIRKVIATNVEMSLNSEYILKKTGIFNNPNFINNFTLTGSLKVKSLDDIGIAKPYFTRQIGRHYIRHNKYSQEYILRGPRYVAAIDPYYSVLQKLNIYYQDINDGISLITLKKITENKQFLEIAPILDYIKNGLITLYNAYTHREKLGELEINNKQYQELKTELLEALNEAVLCFYLSLINEFTHNKFMDLIATIHDKLLQNILDAIAKEFRQFKFSSRAMVRPEASHPLILSGFCNNLLEKYPATKIVFGLPSGGTELACLLHKYLQYKTQQENQLILLPISMHSTKNDFNTNLDVGLNYSKLIPTTKFLGDSMNALLVDDNSSTGTTIEVAKNLIYNTNSTIKLICSVAEADIIRTSLTFSDMNRNQKMANPKVYTESVGVLPISRKIWKKRDLKEVIESRDLYKYYINTDTKNSLVKTIKKEVIADAIENNYERIKHTLKEHNSILIFKNTFLSNFYPVDIEYKGKLFPSVEHAYLCQKYNPSTLKNLNKIHTDELNEIFALKGLETKLADFSTIFFNRNLAPGVIKRISNKLKSWGYEIKEWDNIRVELMIELQLKKYSNPKIKKLLIETDTKYLIEGNDWNDTFWGIAEDRGKNFLGRIIMNIRSKINK